MTRSRPFAELAAEVKADPLRRERIETSKRAMRDAMALAALRTRRGATESDVVAALGVTREITLSIEHEEDPYLSTLRDYAAALGGELALVAVFPDTTVTLAPTRRR